LYKVLRISSTVADLSLLGQCSKQAIGRSISEMRDKRTRKSPSESYAITLIDALGTIDHEDDLLCLYPVDNHISFGYLFILPDSICLDFVSYVGSGYIVLATVKPSIKMILVTQTLSRWQQTILSCKTNDLSLYEDSFIQVFNELKSDGLTKHWKD
jgi:hypothetical protein